MREMADPDPKHLVRQLLRLAHAQFDMRSAIACARLLLDHHDRIGPLTYGLLTGFVVSYGRPFTESRAHGRLEAKWSTFPSDRPVLKKYHDRLIELRNTLAAHTDETSARKVAVVTRGATGNDRPLVTEGRSAIDAGDIEEAIELLEFQEARFGEAAQELAERLQDLGYWPEGVMLEIDAAGFTILDPSSETFADSRSQAGPNA
jgi:hypothetical protein